MFGLFLSKCMVPALKKTKAVLEENRSLNLGCFGQEKNIFLKKCHKIFDQPIDNIS